MADELSPDDVKVIFEDDDVIVVTPLTYEGNKYYGKKTPWFEEGWYGNQEFEKRLKNGGRIYYIVNKKTGEKEAFYKDRYNQVFYNESTKLGKPEIEDLVKFAPSAKKIIWELTGSDVFKKLRQFAKGQITDRELIDSDDMIYKIDVNSKSKGDSVIVLEFKDDEKLFEALDFSDDDIWFVNTVMSRDYEFKSSDQMYYDSRDGYGIFRYLNKEQEDKLKRISFIVDGREVNLQNEREMGDLYEKLHENFDRYIDRMEWALIENINEKSSERARVDIKKEILDYLSEKGFTLTREFDRISITVAELVYMFAVYGNRNASLNDLVTYELEPGPRARLGGWSDDQYEYETYSPDESTDRVLDNNLDEILEKLEEDESLKEYFEIYNRIESKYRFDTWHELPRDKNIMFKVDKLGMNLKLHVSLRKKDGNYFNVNHQFTEENFNKFLHNPELFSIFNEK